MTDTVTVVRIGTGEQREAVIEERMSGNRVWWPEHLKKSGSFPIKRQIRRIDAL